MAGRSEGRTEEDRLAAEQRARVLIDRQLTEAGWVVRDRKALNLFAGHLNSPQSEA